MSSKNIFSGLSEEVLKKRKKKNEQQFITPMLATLTENYFSSNDWMYEHKFDGVRCLAFKRKGIVQLKSRTNKIMQEYPEIVTALSKQKADNFIIDGEIVSLNKKGISDFQMLQSRMNVRSALLLQLVKETTPLYYCIFDVLYADGYDVTALPLSARKEILRKLLSYNKTLLYSQFQIGNGVALFKKACKLGWEGIIAKHSNSAYLPVRSREWLKFKCSASQELVIGGYTEPQGAREFFGALLVGYYDHGKLMFAGKVGTGFSYETLAVLGKKLQKLEIKKCPFSNYDQINRAVHWVKPTLVAEFHFAQWTKDGKLRAGRYKGLREDKKAQDVVREVQ
jgi:bifunctional non-homologous end joining protein LigD